jgi:hypothetical protein
LAAERSVWFRGVLLGWFVDRRDVVWSVLGSVVVAVLMQGWFLWMPSRGMLRLVVIWIRERDHFF